MSDDQNGTIPSAAKLAAEIAQHIIRKGGSAEAFKLTEYALNCHPTNGALLSHGSLAALLENKPARALAYQKRLRKHYSALKCDYLYEALAFAQQGRWYLAAQLLKKHSILTLVQAFGCLPYKAELLWVWLDHWVNEIQVKSKGSVGSKKSSPPVKKSPTKTTTVNAKRNKKKPLSNANSDSAVPSSTVEALAGSQLVLEEQYPPLTVHEADIAIQFNLTLEPDTISPSVKISATAEDNAWYRLRADFAHLSLLQGFDELLCIPLLHDVDVYWYQIETVRKVLKQFRGRVLLADEVGLGKTIEAGMVLKEYLLRGMAERVLILTPASLVGQWCEEMATKFSIDFATSYDSLLRSDAVKFWAQPRVIASIATARRQEHFLHLANLKYDLIIVDEAHHLKNRATSNWKLVDSLQKRFLLLLSATPVQNSLVELYNLLTLLKPGIFKTEKEFRSAYMTPRKPRIPANREAMRNLMRDVMIRNTRSLVDVRLPPRHAITLRLDPSDEEQACYQTMSELLASTLSEGSGQHRMSLSHLLSAAGSSPASAFVAITRFIDKYRKKNSGKNDILLKWAALCKRYESLAVGVKERALFELLAKNPQEKKMIFIHHRETLTHLDNALQTAGIEFARFDGSMSGPMKDAAIERFRAEVPVLLCTESGGEGRNVQFCNTLINFDLPWNPMLIEQRIGRVHRIGQERDVYVFNLAIRGTIEEQVLRILDEKINMFELVVGEISAILGEMDDTQDFANVVFSAWVDTTASERDKTFDALGDDLVAAKSQYESAKALDDELFGDEFETV